MSSNVHDLYRLAREVQSRPPIDLTEDELKTQTRKNTKCIFANEDMMKKYEQLPEDVKHRFKNYGNDYYSRVIDNVSGTLDNVANECLLAVRSGLSPKDLTEDELLILRTVYGPKWYESAGLENEDDM